ncbi:zf-HC2 domain-containing protein [Streptomyces gardneri]|uniref:anti-sigma factor family protein n=1 Tax=Streptomyces gardneri TaxID=66892 RepID=UPI000A4E1071|nr:zf-HC2 domain-containing protein [Streptomyces gardneri]QPK47824.1 zf-HC2 domain-containing protein [Streptomyces gardneri]WRK39277.1 zf-HC2 domain-containing protein [Streptomyces venezuelae]
MSGTRPSSPTPAEHHLGDRLAALVDGELGHDARERVLAHLATCARCKAEADAQRTVKSVFASAAPPPPSEGFLARLQGLPGGPGEPSGGSGGPGVPRGPLEELLGAAALKSDGFATAAVVTPNSPHPGTGFRIHEVGDRGSGTSGRGRRFAFAAASAVSFAAIALGGTLPVETSVSASGRGGQGTGSAVTPMRATATGGASGTTAATRGTRSGERSGAQSVAEEPLTPLAARTGAPAGRAPAGTVPSGAVPPDAVRSGRAPLVAVRLQNQAMQSFLALSPFIRPTGPALDLAFAPGPSPAASPTNAPLGSHR